MCDEHGNPLFHFEHFVPGKNEAVPGEPRSIVVDGKGRMFVTDDRSDDLDILDPTGRSIVTTTPPRDECATKESFELLALGPDGVYASLSCKERKVVVIGDDLQIARTIDLAWRDPDEMACITGLAVDGKGAIYVTDACASLMVQMYAPDGSFINAFGNHETGLDNFSFASGIAVMGDGTLWVIDTLRHIVSRFTREGQRIVTLGGKGSEPGSFEYPSSISTDGADRIFIVERVGNRYQCFRLDDGLSRNEVPAQR